MPLAAVVLAAGASSRMGRPKALLRWRGRPFVLHAIDQARHAGARPVAVVQGAVPLPEAAQDDALVVLNEAWAEGQLGSLQRGLWALERARRSTDPVDLGSPVAPVVPLPAHADDEPWAVLVLTVDRPHLAPQTLQALARAAAEDPRAIWQPRLGPRRGHPIVYPADLVPRLLALRPPQTPRDLLAEPEIASRRRQVPVDDPAVLDNIDRPEDLVRLPS